MSGPCDQADLAVIIPTRDRPGLLVDCLSTLASQQTAAKLEVLVVDDGSLRPLAPAVAQFAAETVTFRTLRTPPGGLNVARNKGVDATQAPLVAFLDDDTLVSCGWADAVLAAFRSLTCAGLAGRILLHYESPRPSWLWVDEHGYLSGFDAGEKQVLLASDTVPTGANCAVTRDWFNRIGGFKTGLDRNANSLLSGGDTDFFRRIVRAGGTIGYSPQACVRHRVPAERLTLRYFVKRGKSQGLSDALMEGRPTTALELASWWVRTLRRIARTPLVLAKNLLLRRGPLAPATWVAGCVGRLSALRYWRRLDRSP